MSTMFPKLFEPGRIGQMKVKNRIIKAPQHTCLAAPDGTVTERLIRYYKEVACGGAGLVIVEYAWMDKKFSQAAYCQVSVAGNEFIAGLSLLAQIIQAHGAKAALQIEHCGSQKSVGAISKAPSRVPSERGYLKFGTAPEELTFEEIQEIIQSFGDAAKRAQIADFDMVEIHGSHGYLISEFLSPHKNKRNDWYGGSLDNRMRFLLQIVENTRAKVGPGFPICVRLNGTDYEPNGVMIEDTVEVAKALEKLGVDVIHISGGNHHQVVHLVSPMCITRGHNVWAAEAVKKAVRIPIIASGSITTPEYAEEILGSGEADFISLGRPLFADPYWPQKAREGRPEDIAPCIRCDDGCIERSNGLAKAILCTVNVALGKEDEFTIVPTENPKKVVVVGGGPAGMEAARVCALRGHTVTLYEKRKLGGALLEASVPEFKSELRRLVDYFVTQTEKLKINVVVDEATVSTIKNGGFDAVIVATGGIPIELNVQGINKPFVTGALDVLNGKAPPGQRVAIIGGGMVGTEVGLYLAEQGKEITFIEMQDKFMTGVMRYEQIVYEERLDKLNVTILTGARLEGVIDNGVIIVDKYGKRDEVPADSVVLAVGFTSQTDLVEQLEKENGLDVYVVGDCVNPRKIFEAIHEGHIAARKI
ncbi:FAD-dependent oxidoreductase [Chloroflexota bacterium]